MTGRERATEREPEAMEMEVAETRAHDALGERVRTLRTTAGLTQSELAAGRFTKEYVSQIERSKTRPTVETVEWIAERLGVDADLLLTGVSSRERDRWEGALARAEALNEQYRYADAIPELRASCRRRAQPVSPSSSFALSPARAGRACRKAS